MFQRKNNIGKNIVDFKVANVLRLNENNNLPSKSKLNKTRSDIFGELKYKLNEYSSLGYNFSYDSNLKYTNFDNSGMIGFDAEKGTGLIFPSWLQHWVTKTNKTRISISWNILLRGDYGQPGTLQNSHI